jgi:hypothetical protein
MGPRSQRYVNQGRLSWLSSPSSSSGLCASVVNPFCLLPVSVSFVSRGGFHRRGGRIEKGLLLVIEGRPELIARVFLFAQADFIMLDLVI